MWVSIWTDLSRRSYESGRSGGEWPGSVLDVSMLEWATERE
jgi:hypothetical protein